MNASQLYEVAEHTEHLARVQFLREFLTRWHALQELRDRMAL